MSTAASLLAPMCWPPQSEFSHNTLNLNAVAGKNHCVRQSMKMAVFVGGAKLTEVPEFEGQQAVRNTKLAR